ncbi:multiubiquitin domain-containing protein [Rhizobium leguminosarum]|nr:multiubiquitin domain-containing protein [Rhizobium leguminosarum]UIK09677.1 multiubiquitin domain-containing protein [Rhizobium leguminosarum]UIL26857.1 multiubiquitin domain-containing protein [Rhizobium leguminosarum]
MNENIENVPDAREPSGDRRTVFISDETFSFERRVTDDDKISGAQIAELVGKHPVEDYVVLHHLPTGELESKRPTETTRLVDNNQHFFVIKSTGTGNAFYVDGLSMEWPRGGLTADQMIYLARADAESEVVTHPNDGPAEVYEGDDEIRLDTPGVEKFSTRPARQITITVDGEPYVPPKRRMTPNSIIVEAASLDPSLTYLVRIKRGDERKSYQGKGDVEIRLRDGMNFITVSTGPTTVSDPAHENGVGMVLKGLAALGYSASVVDGKSHHVIFDYSVQSGPYAGRVVKVGLIIPTDFPLSWPSGIHVSPDVHPLQTGGEHPKGGIYREHSADFQSALGGQWQYWSRPFNFRGGRVEPVQAYLTHIWQLWDSQ